MRQVFAQLQKPGGRQVDGMSACDEITVVQIRAGRAMARLTQAQLAARAGISTTAMNNIEQGTDAKGSTLRAIQAEHIDVELIDSARHEFGFAAYVLTDWSIIQALTRAANRGVKVRIYLDGSQLREREPVRVFQENPRR